MKNIERKFPYIVKVCIRKRVKIPLLGLDKKLLLYYMNFSILNPDKYPTELKSLPIHNVFRYIFDLELNVVGKGCKNIVLSSFYITTIFNYQCL